MRGGRALLVLAALLAGARGALAQPEVVPAEHAIYDFLLQQRVAGHLPFYRHEHRPQGRADIRQALDSLDARADDLGGAARRWLALYRQEFFEPEGARETVFGEGTFRLPHRPETEKYFYFHQGADWRLAWEVTGRLGARIARDSADLAGGSISGETVVEGNYRGRVGFYTRLFNGAIFSGQPRVLQRDPDLRPLYYPQVQPDDGQFDQSSASVRVAGGPWFAEVAQQRLRVGAGYGDGLVLSGDADYFPSVQVGVRTPTVDYTALHGALGALPHAFTDEDRPDEGGILGGAERYFALHRLAVYPTPALMLAFTEAIVYANRGPELTYLVPVNPFKTAEHTERDQDNPLFTLEVLARPLRGAEVYGTVLVDDANLGLLGKGSYSNKMAFQGGVAWAGGPAMLFAEYTRIDPFVYTHRFFRDGAYYNSFTHYGFSLGHPIGPNADQLAVGARAWLPGRLHAALTGRYNRRGEDYVAADGTLVTVGGDVNNGRQPPFEQRTKRFLGGSLFRGAGARAEVSWEPLRDLALFRVWADYQRWDRDPDTFFLRADVVFTL